MRGSTVKWVVVACLLVAVDARRKLKRDETESLKSLEDIPEEDSEEVEPCQCGVFMSQQVGIKEGRRGRPRGPPEGEPVVTYDTDEPSLPCGHLGNKGCISKCVDVILKYLPRAGPVICGAVERDVRRERAYLFVRNCAASWTPTNFSAGKEFCCTDGQHHKSLLVICSAVVRALTGCTTMLVNKIGSKRSTGYCLVWGLGEEFYCTDGQHSSPKSPLVRFQVDKEFCSTRTLM